MSCNRKTPAEHDNSELPGGRIVPQTRPTNAGYAAQRCVRRRMGASSYPAAAVARLGSASMKYLRNAYSFVHACMAALFACAALYLLAIAARMGWSALADGASQQAAQVVIEAIGLLATGVVALQISQTIAEEEVIRDAHISAPTRVRRFLSRFLVVVVVALAIEGLVATFKALHENPEQLPHAAALLAAVALLLMGWGVFLRMNRYAEELEPEAMREAKTEDSKLKD